MTQLQSDQSQDKPVMKIIGFGIGLIFCAILSLLSAPNWTRRPNYIDGPCWSQADLATKIDGETKAVYCISTIPRDTKSGIGTYARGVSNADTFELPLDLRREIPDWHGTLTFQVDRDFVTVKDQTGSDTLIPGDIYHRVRAMQSPNLWLLMSAHFSITNAGLKIGSHGDALYITGTVVEGWLPSPLGLAVYGLGLGLVLNELWKTRQLRDRTSTLSTAVLAIGAGGILLLGWLALLDEIRLIVSYLFDPYIDLRVASGNAFVHFVNSGLLIGISILCVGLSISRSLGQRSAALSLVVNIIAFLMAFFLWMCLCL